MSLARSRGRGAKDEEDRLSNQHRMLGCEVQPQTHGDIKGKEQVCATIHTREKNFFPLFLPSSLLPFITF